MIRKLYDIFRCLWHTLPWLAVSLEDGNPHFKNGIPASEDSRSIH